LGRYEEWLADYEEFETKRGCSMRNQRETCLKKYRYYYYKALEDLTKSLEIEPNNLGSLRIRGETYYIIGKDNEALVDLNKLLKIEPNDAFALRIRGSAYRMLKRFKESLADLSRSL